MMLSEKSMKRMAGVDPRLIAVKAAAQQLNIAVEWGGDWTTFKDGPNFQLKRISK